MESRQNHFWYALIAPPFPPFPPPIQCIPVPANKKRKMNEVTSKADVSSNDDYPHLLRALGKEEDGFNPRDPTIYKIMQALLAELTDLVSKDYELNIIDSANNSVSYFCMPKTSSNGQSGRRLTMSGRCKKSSTTLVSTML